jgi:hypothetical protein
MRKLWPWLFVLVAPACNCSGRLSPTEAARACLVLQSCFPKEWTAGYWGTSLTACTSSPDYFSFPAPGGIDGNPAYQTGLEGPMGDIYRCLSSAGGDCATAGTCWALKGGGGTCSPPTGLAQGQCSGTQLSGCTLDGYTFNVDCSHYSGEQCGPASILLLQYSACTFGECQQSQTQCEGSKAELCTSSLSKVDCSREDRSCSVRTDGGGATCTTSQTCDPTTMQATCNGNVSISCPDGMISQFDCSSFPVSRRCNAGACTYTGNACTESLAPSCNGTQITFCQDGNVVAYDCAAMGFSGCTTGQCTP